MPYKDAEKNRECARRWEKSKRGKAVRKAIIARRWQKILAYRRQYTKRQSVQQRRIKWFWEKVKEGRKWAVALSLRLPAHAPKGLIRSAQLLQKLRKEFKREHQRA